jgi:hypothetical protein
VPITLWNGVGLGLRSDPGTPVKFSDLEWERIDEGAADRDLTDAPTDSSRLESVLSFTCFEQLAEIGLRVSSL